MNRISNTKAFRRVGAAAVVGALVVAGAGIAGASTNTNARGVVMSTLSARAANHHHGSSKVRHIEGWIKSITAEAGIPTSILVITHLNVPVTVTFLPGTPGTPGTSGTVVAMDHVKLNLINLAAGERVHVTAASAPTSTTSSYVAATVMIQSTKVHPIDGVIATLNLTDSQQYMTFNTPKKGTVTVYLGAETVVVNGGIVSSLSSNSLSVGQHVHVILVPTTPPTAPSTAPPTIPSTALLVRVQNQS